MAMQNRDRLLSKLKRIQGAPRKAMRAALEKGAAQIVASQKAFVPVKSGALRNSIGYTFGNYAPANANVRGVSGGGGGDPDLSVIIHAGDAEAFYAAFVEFGTAPHDAGGMFKGSSHPGADAAPFFYPGYRLNKRRVKSALTRAVKKAIKEQL